MEFRVEVEVLSHCCRSLCLVYSTLGAFVPVVELAQIR